MAKFINNTHISQVLYTKYNQSVTVEPGKVIDESRLGYKPTKEMGFSPVGLFQGLLKKEDVSVRNTPTIAELEATKPASVLKQNPSDKPRPDPFEGVGESTRAAIRALQSGKSSEVVIPDNNPYKRNAGLVTSPATPTLEQEIDTDQIDPLLLDADKYDTPSTSTSSVIRSTDSTTPAPSSSGPFRPMVEVREEVKLVQDTRRPWDEDIIRYKRE